MNIEHLKLFIRVAATQNISHAGNDLGLSPAVSSAYINKLEKSLGVRLVHRTTRRVSLTEEGHAFLPHAVEVLSTIEVAKGAVGVGSLVPQGKLRVAAPASFGRMHLVPVMANFLARYPELEVDIRLSDSVIDMVEGGFDIAIRDASLNDSTLVARKVASDRRIICASPDYIARHGVPEQPEDLVNHQCVNLMGFETWHFQVGDKVKPIKTKNQLRMDNGEAVRDACIAGIGITYTSTWCSYEALRKKQLVQILSDYPLASDTKIWAVYPSTRMLATKVRIFIDYLVAQFGENPYWDEALQSDNDKDPIVKMTRLSINTKNSF